MKCFHKLPWRQPLRKKISGGEAELLRLRKNTPRFLARQISPIFLLLTLLILTFQTPVAAQFHFKTWMTEQGLPYKTVKSVLQTRDGYVWAATDDGLARFDGVRFTVFNTGNTKNLPTNRLDHLVEAGDGSLWMSALDRGLIRYKDGTFKNYTTFDGLPSDQIGHLVFARSENLLRVVTNKGAAHLDGERFVAENFVRLAFDEKNSPLLDNAGAIWVRQDDKMHRFTKEREEIFQLPKSLLHSTFHFPFRDRAGNFWLLSGDAGYVLRFRDAASDADVFSRQDGLPGKFNKFGQPGGYSICTFEDSKGNLWFGGRNGGLSIYKDGEFRLLTKAQNGLPSDGFHSFAQDREGGVWAGTDDGGLARFSPQIVTALSTADGLTGDSVYPLMEDSNGAIWIGAWLTRQGLTKYENGKFSEIPTKGSLFTSLFHDHDGAVWVGSHNFYGKIENGKFRVVAEMGKVYRAIAQDGAGAIWLGTEDGELWRIADGETRVFTRGDGLPGGIFNLHIDRSGTLWIGTSGGLAKMSEPPAVAGGFPQDLTRPLPQAVLTVYTEADGLSGNHIRSIYEDADGALWLGSFDNGITRLKDGKFSPIRMQNGLHDNGAFQILEDDFGRFWISSNRGIYRANKQELNDFADGRIASVTSVAYGVKDGMLDAECNGGAQPAGFKSRKDGRLWFPTQKGVVVIDPKALPVNPDPPNVVIEDVLIDRQSVLSAGAMPNNPVEVSPEQNSLEIHYTGLSFVKPEQIRFRYKLENLHDDWVETGTRRTLYFDRLPPGEYVFRVSAANADGVWNETGAALKISVKPPFYRTYWFLALCLIGVAAVIAVVFNARIKSLEKRRLAQEEFSRKLLESQERERQRVASELHDSIGQNLLIIKNWALIGRQNKANGEKQFDEISETASASIKEVREIAYDLRPFHLDRLGLSKTIESMLEKVSESSPIEFVWEIDSIDGFFPKEAEINFYRVVQESVNNIVKHSEATEAGVRIKRNDKQLRLSVWDNGKGFETNSLAAVSAGQRGFGMAGIGERARILGGRLTVNSAPGEGTNINLTITAKG